MDRPCLLSLRLSRDQELICLTTNPRWHDGLTIHHRVSAPMLPTIASVRIGKSHLSKQLAGGVPGSRETDRRGTSLVCQLMNPIIQPVRRCNLVQDLRHWSRKPDICDICGLTLPPHGLVFAQGSISYLPTYQFSGTYVGICR